MRSHIFTVELRIFSKTLDPSQITRESGLTPSSVRQPGSVRSDGKRLDAMWCFNGAEAEGGRTMEWSSLEEGLIFVMDKVWPHRDVIAGYQPASRVMWWCGHFQTTFDGGPTLSPSLLKRLGEFGAELFIDNYFHSE
jgi:hypothetical protein